jgi:O-Antigen ligase
VSHESVLPRSRLASMYSPAAWTVLAVLVGCSFALSGIAGLFVAVAVASVALFAIIAAKYPALVLSAAVLCLGLMPFPWSVLTGLPPKLFADETVLVLYLAVLPLLYLFAGRTWRSGFRALYIFLAVFVCTQAASLLVAADLVAARNLIETYVLGSLLLVLFLQEVANTNPETVVTSIVWVTVVIAILTVVERIVQRNPIMEHVTDFTYLSPVLARLTDGVYRPYVSFFHPSEAGTFMALGLPFVVHRWKQRRTVVTSLALIAIAGGLLINATRGVWFAVAIAALLFVRNAWLIVSVMAPMAMACGSAAFLAFQATPFMQRLTDPNNLLSRFVFWGLAVKIFLAHPILGVGHMQFKTVYLDYVQDLSNSAHFDISKISVADNMYLTTMAEHGALGLVTLLGALIGAGILLRRSYKKLKAIGLQKEASLVLCAQQAVVIYAATGCFADLNQFTKATKYVFILVGLGLGVGARYIPRRNDSATLKTTTEQPVLLQDV